MVGNNVWHERKARECGKKIRKLVEKMNYHKKALEGEKYRKTVMYWDTERMYVIK